MPIVDEAQGDGSLKRMTSKSVLIAEPGTITPAPSPGLAPVDTEHPQLSSSPKQHRTNASRRLSGRLPERPSPSLHSISSLTSLRSIPSIDPPGTGPEDKLTSSGIYHHQPNRNSASHIISQVAEWLQQEKARRAAQKSRKQSNHAKLAHAANATSALADHFRTEEAKHHKNHRARRDSDLSEGGLALERLEQILSESMSFKDGQATSTGEKRDSYSSRRRPSRKESAKKLMRRNSTVGSSDIEHPDNELRVPSAEVMLDNSKTLGYSGGAALSEPDLTNPSKRASKEKDAWKHFKNEIVTLTHTLRISGWRRVPIERSGDIDVERLSGALTNAVYVVSPPKNLPQTPAITQIDAPPIVPKRPPPKLLLRIYGPQVEHLIDRESELQILRRLARKSIGPRLLGTFTNGRFEQFFYAKTLKAPDLRIPETSKQIAKRMRELHDGINLLKEEREGGPFVWKNWDSWVERCGEITTWLDRQVLSSSESQQNNARSANWRERGLICGVEWPVFRRTVDAYRTWLFSQYGSNPKNIEEILVFAHNDTQYGNLLRLEPSGESPLLLPANEHKQLVVIDFEYASANPRGLEFANHFTEWCYNYHSPTTSYALNEKAYPTPEEQYRFLKAYVQHRPPIQQQQQQADPRTRSTSTHLSPTTAPTPSNSLISSFNLDSRSPPTSGGYAEEERQRELALNAEISRLKHETRLWRVANSAQWVAWGIVQAKVPGMDTALEAKGDTTPTGTAEILSDNVERSPTPGGGSGKHENPTGDRCQPGSDPLTPESQPLADAARDKRPEERELRSSSAGEENGEEEEEEEEEFDYLHYAQQRALFFWGDVLQLGLVREEDLPVDMRGRVKVVEY